MNKKQLVKAMAELSGLTEKSTEKVLVAFEKVVERELAKGEEVALVGFGRFYMKEQAERVAINPQTKEKITVPAKKKAVFKFGKAFQETVVK